MTQLKGIDLQDVATRLGYSLGPSKKISCPWCGSGEGKRKTPACHIYSDHFYCFSCGKHGDAADLVQAVLGCSFQDAYEFLTGDKLAPSRPESEKRDPSEMVLDVPVGTTYVFNEEKNQIVEIVATKKVVGLKNALRLAKELEDRKLQEETTEEIKQAFERTGNPSFFQYLLDLFPNPLYEAIDIRINNAI